MMALSTTSWNRAGTPLNKSLSNFLDLARWIAALAVLLGHAAVLAQISDIMVAPHGPGVYAWWFLTAFSHQAVLVFFVISGFLVGGDVLRKRRRSESFLLDYYINRFSRIYVVMIPALAFGFIIDSIGRRIFPSSGIYDAPFFEGIYNPANIFWALLQQQSIWTTQAGTNGPLWSLACEMWYYVTFPLLLLPLSDAYSRRVRWAAFMVGAAAVVFMAIPKSFFLFGYFAWIAGALMRIAPRPAIRSTLLSLGLFLVTITVVRLAVRGPLLAAHPILATLADMAVTAAFVNLLLTLRYCEKDRLFAKLRPIHRRLSDFSYSLYATHAPIVFFVWAGAGSLLGRDWHKQLATPLHWSLAFSVIFVAILFAYAFSRVTEAKTPALRAFLRAALGSDRAAGSLPPGGLAAAPELQREEA
jgi:peptidoglycan/LPS O-acetylase OafA/YrhL